MFMQSWLVLVIFTISISSEQCFIAMFFNLNQVVALNIRSNLLEGLGVIVKEGSQAHERKGYRFF